MKHAEREQLHRAIMKTLGPIVKQYGSNEVRIALNAYARKQRSIAAAEKVIKEANREIVRLRK